ncbi:fasciclin-like arabinogalactan protein 14 [Curcuma longa]|uniref:fasciclin-like arabinogalactan protein 14 n=1 Tax=Curcuma longa TaxID=136217 RepID=UPI003D9ECB94
MARLFLLLHYLLFCSVAASAFDVTSILSQFSEFSTFTYLLARTRLAGEINTRKGGVTVLAVENSGLPIAAMSDQPDDVLRKILSLHVILDYLDATRLRRMSTHTAILTTLFQASGRASGLDGFLNITDVNKGGRVAISSAVPGSPPGSYFVKVLVTLPQSISVLQISNVIFPPETGGAWSDGGRAFRGIADAKRCDTDHVASRTFGANDNAGISGSRGSADSFQDAVFSKYIRRVAANRSA